VNPNDLVPVDSFGPDMKEHVSEVNAFFTRSKVQSNKDAYTAALNNAAGSLSTFASSIQINAPIPDFLNQLAPVAPQILAIIEDAVQNGQGIEFALELSEASRPLEVSDPSPHGGAPTIPVAVRGSVQNFAW
jgi:hypothetical protein